MPFADVNGIRTFYTDDGSGPPLLFIHGWCCDSNDWIWQIEAFAAAHYRVIALDMPGYGRSGPGADYTPQGYAAHIAELIDHLELEPVIAIGHSLGGIVVSALAIEHPSLVKAVVGVDPAYGVGEELLPLVEQIGQQLSGDDPHSAVAATWEHLEGPGTPPALKLWHRRRLFGVPADIVRATFHGQFLVENPVIIRPTSDAYIARRTCPSLTIWADVERAKWEPDLLQHPYSRAIPWEGAGHWLHQERPDEFNAIVLNWIDGLPARDVELNASSVTS